MLISLLWSRSARGSNLVQINKHEPLPQASPSHATPHPLCTTHTHIAYARLLCHAHTHRCTHTHVCALTHTHIPFSHPSFTAGRPVSPESSKAPWSFWDLHMLPRPSAWTLRFLAPPRLKLLKHHSRAAARARYRTVLVTCPPDYLGLQSEPLGWRDPREPMCLENPWKTICTHCWGAEGQGCVSRGDLIWGIVFILPIKLCGCSVLLFKWTERFAQKV